MEFGDRLFSRYVLEVVATGIVCIFAGILLTLVDVNLGHSFMDAWSSDIGMAAFITVGWPLINVARKSFQYWNLTRRQNWPSHEAIEEVFSDLDGF